MGDLLLARHGETEWSRSGRHTGRSDLPLTRDGEAQARALAPLLAGRSFALVLTSPLARARRTAELAGLADASPEPDLREWDYGGYEGVTTADIRRTRPGWDLWTDGVPPGPEFPGESPGQVGARADRVLSKVAGALDAGDVMLVAHGHLLRVLTARRLGLPPADGRLFRLETGALSRLSLEHGSPVIEEWNTRT
ncbi:histidine phosphatase family protein [Streptomyces sp. KMM 9044]|uniref:histidine phosphatase family protein n=1 Tax=Streptomyces sp. KMM 9044 TaxID=2744474 RepID=UPI0021514684|nr:histidine phosphatase family protein [Streptomyces sp. KMM 9044]WAX76810.1 histidine phosphatase family protein [Streptomyces sp. KMM 9044]